MFKITFALKIIPFRPNYVQINLSQFVSLAHVKNELFSLITATSMLVFGAQESIDATNEIHTNQKKEEKNPIDRSQLNSDRFRCSARPSA